MMRANDRSRSGGRAMNGPRLGRAARLAPVIAILIAMPALAGPAERAYKARDLSRARRMYEDRLRKRPGDDRSRYNLGNVLYRSSDLKAAEEAWRSAAASKDPDVRARAAHNLGNAQLQSGRIADAIGSYVEALRAEPGNPDSKYNLELALRMLQQQQQRQNQQQGGGKGSQDKQQQKDQQDQQSQGQQQGEQRRNPEQPPDDRQDRRRPQPAPGDYSREDAERVLDGLKQEERDLMADRLRMQGRNVRVEKDW